MSLSIQEIFYSDNIRNLVDKVNKNFDNIVINGGGPRGVRGLQGIQGPSGPTGRRGENTYFDDGTGLPITPPIDVIIGDNFVLSNGDVYEWDGTVWVLTGTNLRGPQGIQGPSGASLDFDRYAGGYGSTFPLGLFYYPQNPPTLIPTPNQKDFITLKRGGLDVLFLGDANKAYGDSGALSGISNMPNMPNTAKIWVIQDALVGGGKNGITIGAAGAKNSTDDINTYANFEQFANLYIATDGSFNISMTAGGITEPKPINISTDARIDLSAGDVINNHFFVGLDTTDNKIGVFGNLVDKIDLTTTDIYLKAKNNFEFTVDSDLSGVGYLKTISTNLTAVNPTTPQRTITSQIISLQTSNDTTHYSDGFAIVDQTGNTSAKFELFKFGSKTYTTLGVSNTTNEGKNLMISSDGVVLVSPSVLYPLTPISTWLNQTANTSIGSGSLSVYKKIRMVNTGGTLSGGLLFAGNDGVFDYVNADTGTPISSTNFIIGLLGREIANNRTYLAKIDDFFNIGDRSLDDGNSLLVLSTARPGGTYRQAKMTLETSGVNDIPKIGFKNAYETSLESSPQVNANRKQILPKSAGAGGVLMSFTDNNNQFDDSWEEYQVIVDENALPIGSAKLKNDITLLAIGADTGGYINNSTALQPFIISSGLEVYPYGTTGTSQEKRYPSKIHIKRINRDYYFISFSICVFIDPASVTAMTYNNFNFFDFTFSTDNPGVLKPLRNNINIYDNVGGTWFSGSAYMSNYIYSASGDVGSPTNLPNINPTGINNTRRSLVTSSTEFARYQQSKQINYTMNWTVDRISTDRFRLQISTAQNITKAYLRNGFIFSGNAVVYGYRDTDV